MDPFFTDSKRWANGGPFLHFLVLLGEHPDYCRYARAHQELLAQYPGELAAVAEPWLHATVQGIHHPMTTEQTERLRVAARRELHGMRPFSVQVGPTWPGVTAITVAMYPETGMAELNRRTRAAAQSVPGVSLRPAEERFWAHTTLAYARTSFDSRRLNRALRALRPQRVDLAIDRVHLVEQYQDPQPGRYTWKVLEEFRLHER